MAADHHHPRPTRQAVDNAMLHRWYETFRPLTIKSIILLLPPAFTQWLQTDGVILPSSVTLSSVGKAGLDAPDENDGDAAQISFPELEKAMDEAIEELGGAVCPKMNWSVPRDAEWVNGGTLKCETTGDVMLLLKSSDFIEHDISHPYDGCCDVTNNGGGGGGASGGSMFLALRKWANFHPSMHFRCFIRGQTIAGICQRESSLYFPFLGDEVPRLARLITQFFVRNIQGRYPDPDYVMDVYVDKRNRVWLVDFNVFGPVTDALLFCWEDGHGILAAGEEREGAMVMMTSTSTDDEGAIIDDDVQVSEIMEEEEATVANQEHEQEQEQQHHDAEGEGEEGESGRRSSSISRIRSFSIQAPGLLASSFIFRIVGGQGASVGPDPLASYRVPIDIVSMGSLGGIGQEGMMDMQEIMRRGMDNRRREEEEEGESSDDDDDDDDNGMKD